MLSRAYSLITIKSVDESARTITGLATSPEPDRLGDVVEPKGAVFKLPLPLLWQHNSKEPIGHVTRAKVTDAGIEIMATFAKIDEPGKLKDRLDEAWQSVKSGLVQGLSIGFNAIDAEPIKGTFGFRFLKWAWLELSVVTIPAHELASISTVKSLDAATLADSGKGDAGVARNTPALAGRSVAVSVTRHNPNMKKSLSEQIRDFEATRVAKSTERNEIVEASGETGVTLDADQSAKYEELTGEIKSLDEHIVRLKALEEEQKKTAVTVNGSNPAAASDSRSPVAVAVKDTMPSDIAFGAMVLCKAHAFLELQKGNLVSPLAIAKARYPSNTTLHAALEQKTAVAGGTTTDANWAASLLAPAQVLESAFLAYLRPKTLVDRFGTNGVPALKRVPFNVKVQSQTSGASASWVGQGKGKPVTKFNTTDTTLLFTKIAGIAVITEELARFSRPGAEGLVRDELARAVIERMDIDFIDPDKAVSSGVNPASITNGVVGKTTAGTSAANVLTDIQTLVAPFLLNNYDVSQLVLIMPNTLALTLSLMQNSLGQDSFKGMTVNGGTLAGIPVLASQYAANGASYGNMVICVSAENIALADDGTVNVDASREASIEMSDAPANESATPTASAYMVSMFQTNSIAIRAERVINWKKLRTTAVTFMDDVNWGSIGSPF